MHDLVIRGGLVADGAGGEPTPADVAISSGRISKIGQGLGAARRVIDATGLLVSPGFVDVHTHSDFTLPLRPQAEAKLRQGVTTDCTGNCGFSPFPFLSADESTRRHGVFFEPDLDERWSTLAAFARDMEMRELGINIAPLVGLGAIRLAVLGDERRAPTERELGRMQELLAEALGMGAFGASTGLTYAPGGFADVKELVALADTVGEWGRLYATHLRDEGDQLEASLEEAIDTVSRSGTRLQISHLKAFGGSNWGRVSDALEHIDRANAAGLDVAFDVYPYTTACTTLASALPPSTLEGGEARLRDHLADPMLRNSLREMLQNGEKPLDTIILCDVASRPELSGLRLADVAESLDIGPDDLLLELIERDGLQPTMLIDAMSESDVREAVKHEKSMFGSDGWTMSTDALPYAHPRNFAAAVRLVTHYVHDESLLNIGTAVHKLTALPARRLGLHDRGLIAEGHAADICVIDLEGLDDVASVSDPCRYPTGVQYVLVNGSVAVEDGTLTGARAGRVLTAT